MTPANAVVNLRAEPDVPTPAPTRSLAYKLADVMAELHRIPKSGHNDFHNYAYATEADIVEVVRVELAKRHIVLIPAVTKQTREPVGEKGSVLTTLEMEFAFFDGETGEQITRPWLGAGTDKEDKGAYKAMTGATKYFLLKTFLLPTGDDPETDEKSAKPKPTATKAERLPAPKQAPTPRPQTTGEIFTITKVWPKDDAKRKPCGVVFSDDQKFTTFSDTLQATALDFQKRAMPCARVTETNAKGFANLVELIGAMTTGAALESNAEMQDSDEPEWLRDA